MAGGRLAGDEAACRKRTEEVARRPARRVRLEPRIPNAHLRPLPQSKHLGFLEHHATYVSYAEEFARSLEQPAVERAIRAQRCSAAPLSVSREQRKLRLQAEVKQHELRCAVVRDLVTLRRLDHDARAAL